MRSRPTLGLLPLAFLLAVIPSPLGAQTLPCEQVWEYDLPDRSGMAVGTEGYFVWVQVDDDGAPPPERGPLGVDEKAEAYATLNAGAVKAECDASRGHARYLFSHDLSLVGHRLTYDQDVAEERSRFWILDSRGDRGMEQRAHLVETEPYDEGDRCAAMDGAWEYLAEGWDGMFIHNRGYAAAVYTTEDRLPLEADAGAEERASALDGTRAFVHRFTCDGSRIEMEILHSSDPLQVGERLTAEFELHGDSVTWWLLDDGRRGPPEKARRIHPDDPAMEVRAVVGALDRAQNAGNLDAFLELVDDKVVYMPPDSPPIEGKDAVGNFYRGFFGQVDLQIRHVPEETFADGRLVVTRGRAFGTATPTGGAEAPFDNKYVYVLRRGDHGELRFLQVMYNANPLPDTASPR